MAPGETPDPHQTAEQPPARERLIAAAARLFHEQGYHATGVATILREAGVLSGSMYHHFAGKDELLVAVLDRYQRLLRPEVMDRAEAAEEEPLERVFALLGLYRQGLAAAGGSLGCPIGNLALEVSDGHPEARALVDANFRAWAEHVQGWLLAAADRLPAGADLATLSQFVLTVMEGAVMQVRARKSLEPFDAAVAELRRYFQLLQATARSGRRAHQSQGGTG
ncbi:MAG TPA: TetR/AcrR family transcriptional regulator [Thermoanaerobaculia bacterium]|nr:TetR/AcrR family transcriptional regulator [Thermoanaerobaculia bacterium]